MKKIDYNSVNEENRIMIEYRCWFCGGILYWQADYGYDEIYGEGEGIVAFLQCSECHANVEVSQRYDEEE